MVARLPSPSELNEAQRAYTGYHAAQFRVQDCARSSSLEPDGTAWKDPHEARLRKNLDAAQEESKSSQLVNQKESSS